MARRQMVTKSPCRVGVGVPTEHGFSALDCDLAALLARPDAGHGSRRVRSTQVEALNAPASETEPLTVTGLRETAPLGDGDQSRELPESELPVPEGELLGGRYLVERIFAEGGMGIVCLGRHIQLEQPVAIKFLRRALAGRPAVVERFMNEGRALAALRSEHVVRVMDVGQLESGRPYLVMEHLEGIDLDALVDRDGPLSVETAVGYTLQVCEPLAEAHALGIVHRDIKPENLFLWTGGPGEDLVKVLDFGLAKQFGSPRALAVTGPQDSIGSPCYMSPEQVTTPQNIDSRTDIWSLGVVLHRLLTDSLPFDGGGIVEVLSHVLSAAPKSLREARPELVFDPELEAIVHRCLEKSPEARYQTIDELAQALRAYLEHGRAAVALSPLPIESSAEGVPVSGDPSLVTSDGGEAGEETLRIAGLHSRWPAVLLVSCALVVAAGYQAHRTGKLRLKELASATLAPARLGPDARVWAVPDHDQPPIFVSRGVDAAEPTRDANGELVLRAEPERDSQAVPTPIGVAAAAPDAAAGESVPPADAEEQPSDTTTDSPAPANEAERIRKEQAYREYLKSEGLTPIGEALKAIDAN